MPKVKVVKTTVKKKGTKRSGTVGGSSTKNFATKYRNVDYKYRLVDVDDTYSDTVLQRILSLYSTNGDVVSYGTAGQTALVNGIRNSCYFIPLSTTTGIARSMNVNIKCKYPFAYCVFQNTPDFYKYIFHYVQTISSNVSVAGQSKSFPYYFVGNAAQGADSVIFLPCQRTVSEDQGYLANAQWAEGISVLFSQLCQKQSTYKEVYSATNSGLYSANVSVYYKKASQFLSGSLNNTIFDGYASVQKVQTSLEQMYAFSNKTFRDLGSVQTVFRPGDMTLCILPMFYFYNKMLDESKLPSSNLTIYPFSFDIKRRIYRLNQDNGLQEAAERIINDKVTTITQVVNKVAQVPTTANQGNNFNFNNALSQFVQRCAQGVLGRPKILRADLDTAGQNCNCIIVDDKCYDPATETLQLQAYMDLQAVPATAGTNVVNNFEDEDTFNCNVITQAANVDFEQTNQIIQLPFISQGALSASTSETIQQTNTGPSLVAIAQQPYVIDSYDSTLQGSRSNITYNVGFTEYVYNAIQTNGNLILGQPAAGGVAPLSILGGVSPDADEFTILKTWMVLFKGVADSIHMRLTAYRSSQVNFNIDSQGNISGALAYSFTPEYLASDLVYTMGYTPVNTDDGRAVIDLKIFYSAFSYDWNGSHYKGLAIGPGCLTCRNAEFPFNAEQHIEITAEQYFSLISLLTTPMMVVQMAADYNVKYLTLNDLMMTYNDGRQYPTPTFLSSAIYTTTTSLGVIPSPSLIVNYLYEWTNAYHKAFVTSKAGWKRFKGFLGKCWKWIKNAIPKGKKIIHAIAPFVPAPYSTAVVAVADKVDNIVTNLDTIAVKKTSSTFTAAVLDDEEDDVFVITPQYRLSTSDEPADIGATGDDWIDGESYEQPCNAYGAQTLRAYRFDFTQHPVYGEYFRNRRLGLQLGDASTIYCQQRIKVNFRKRCSQAIASAYKAILTLGSDTNYLTPDDYQEQQ